MEDFDGVPLWVPGLQDGGTVDVYPVREGAASDGSVGGKSAELVLNRKTLTTGYAERRASWEFDSCISEGGGTGSGGNPAAFVNAEMLVKIRADAVSSTVCATRNFSLSGFSGLDSFLRNGSPLVHEADGVDTFGM